MRRPGPSSRASILFALLLGTSAVACSSGAGEETGTPGLEDAGTDETSNEDASTDGSASDGSTKDDAASDGLVEEDTMPPEDSAPPVEAGDGGTIPGCGFDSDGDGIIDAIEGRGKGPGGTDVDTDGDGTPDYLDDDSDDDGIPDVVEWAEAGCESEPFAEINDADGDGIPNFQDLDSDGNGLPDKNEVCPPAGVLTALGFPACEAGKPYDFDGDGRPDYLDFDNDHDSSNADKAIGLPDSIELADATGKYVGLVDSDGDGIPDVYDRDSDNDFILDLDDGVGDPDGDGKQSFRDTDSDGDGVGDACEARGKASPGAGDYSLPLVDTDGDGAPDFLDRDSDGDLLADGLEDKNGNCKVDSAETDRRNADTDGDGVSDLIEVTLLGAAGAKDPTQTPAKAGKFYFLVPYSADGAAKPTPTSSPLALSTQLNKGDVAFIVDTTGSMGGTISNLKSSLSTTIIPALKTKIPSLGIGIAAHDDFPYSGYGSASSGDKPFYFPTTTGTSLITTVTASSQAAANALTTHYGGDNPESNVPAMYKALTGVALTWPGGGTTGADSPAAGTFGAMHFRSDALPILINLTDITSHNSRRALDKTGTSYSGLEYAYSFTTFNIDQLVAKFNELGAKFIGGAADGGTRSTAAEAPYGFLSYIADKTGSVAPPSVFGAGSTTCKTGVNGAAIAADGPTIGGVKQCRMVFSFNSNGTGLSTSIVDGVFALLASIKFDVYVEAYNGAGEPIDVVTTFMDKVEPQPSGGTDPMTGTACVSFPASQLADVRKTPKAVPGAGDIAETIKQVNPGNYYCFSVVPKPNTSVAATTAPQTYRAWLKVLAVKPGGSLTLGTDREVLFIVPPVLN